MKQSTAAQPYEQAIERILFHNAVLMGLSSRFDGACNSVCSFAAGICCNSLARRCQL